MKWLLPILLLAAVPGPARADVLSLIAERAPEGEVVFWWADPELPAPTALDVLLWSSGGPWLDPRTLPDPPSVSRIYLVPDLSDVGARNLAGLYGADRVLVGELALGPPRPTAAHVAEVVQARLQFRLLAVSGSAAADVVEHVVVGAGVDAASAAADVRAQVASLLVETALPAAENRSGAEPSPDTPELVVEGLAEATPLVALMAQLRAHSEVVADLQERWATPGTLALAVALQPARNADDLARVLETLAATVDWGYQLVVARREGGRFAVRIEPAPPARPAVPLEP